MDLNNECLPYFVGNTIQCGFSSTFHPNTINYEFWPNFHLYTIHYGFRMNITVNLGHA